MKLMNREEFLALEYPVLYVKCDKYGNSEGELGVSYGKYGNNDFLDLPLHSFMKEYGSGYSPKDYGEQLELKSKILEDRDNHFEWDYSMTGRDGLYDEKQMFFVYEQLDLLKLMRMLDKIYLYQSDRDEYNCKYYEP